MKRVAGRAEAAIRSMRQGSLCEWVAPHSTACAKREVGTGTVGLSIVSMDGALIEPDAVCTGGTPPGLVIGIKGDGRGCHGVMLALVESLKCIRG